MPFPPTFDHVWDLTQPPDTQLASMGAADFRNLKDDVMQRLSLLSGTLANRPTPETINATWGGVGFGLLYFSTDNGKIYQWSGAAWVDVTSSFLAPSTTPTFVVKKGSGNGTDYSVGSSGSYADVDTTNLAYTTNVAVGQKLLITAFGEFGPTGGASNTFTAAIFDTQGSAILAEIGLIGGVAAATFFPFYVAAVLVGDGNSHTLKLQYRNTTAGSGVEMKNASSTRTPTMIFTLTTAN